MRHPSVIGLVAAMLLASVPALAQSSWSMHKAEGGVMVATPKDLPPGATVMFATYPPAVGDVSAMVAQRVAEDVAGAGQLVQEHGPKQDQLGGVPVISDMRLYQSPQGGQLLHIFYGGVGGDGKTHVFLTVISADETLYKRYLPTPAKVITGLLKFVPKQTASAAPRQPSVRQPRNPMNDSLPEGTPGQGIQPGDIDRIMVDHFFGYGVGGIKNTYNLFVLLKDGTFYANPIVAPGDLDLARSHAQEAFRWGRWEASGFGGDMTLTWNTGAHRIFHASQIGTCRPAEPGLTLERSYTHTGGSGPIIPGGIATLSEANLNLHADGSFDRASATAVGGGSVGGGVSSPRNGGRYSLDGYTIEMDPASGPAQRRFFCRLSDDDNVVFIGNVEWFVWQKTP